MKSIKVTVLGKQYPLKIADHDEMLMHQIAGYVDKRFRDFKNALANQNETTIMTLAALSIAEELFLEMEKKSAKSDNSEEVFGVVNKTLENFIAEIKHKNNDLED